MIDAYRLVRAVNESADNAGESPYKYCQTLSEACIALNTDIATIYADYKKFSNWQEERITEAALCGPDELAAVSEISFKDLWTKAWEALKKLGDRLKGLLDKLFNHKKAELAGTKKQVADIRSKLKKINKDKRAILSIDISPKILPDWDIKYIESLPDRMEDIRLNCDELVKRANNMPMQPVAEKYKEAADELVQLKEDVTKDIWKDSAKLAQCKISVHDKDTFVSSLQFTCGFKMKNIEQLGQSLRYKDIEKLLKWLDTSDTVIDDIIKKNEELLKTVKTTQDDLQDVKRKYESADEPDYDDDNEMKEFSIQENLYYKTQFDTKITILSLYSQVMTAVSQTCSQALKGVKTSYLSACNAYLAKAFGQDVSSAEQTLYEKE